MARHVCSCHAFSCMYDVVLIVNHSTLGLKITYIHLVLLIAIYNIIEPFSKECFLVLLQRAPTTYLTDMKCDS